MMVDLVPRFTLPADAEVSACGRYRWWLTRVWQVGGPICAFLMLNPSTADARLDDPTIRRCIRFAQRWGFGGLAVANLYPWRSSSPGELVRLRAVGADVVGPADAAIVAVVAAAKLTVAAWGAHPLADERAPAVRSLLGDKVLHHLGLTISGAPKHPLARGRHRIPDDTQPMAWAT